MKEMKDLVNKRILNWLLLLAFVLGGLTGFVSCETDDNHAHSNNGENPSGRTYSSEVYVYLNKANDRENMEPTGAKGYTAKEWRLEVKNTKQGLPDNFRTCESEFNVNGLNTELPEPNYIPSRQGLEGLNISGSGRLSEKQLKVLTDEINKKAGGRTKVMMDLRSECHGFIHGHHMSWYGYINWSNIGKKRDQILAEEEQLLNNVKGKTIVAGKISSANNYLMTDSTWILVDADSALTEKQVVERYGWEYRRVTALDHVFPCDEIIDQFIETYRSLPKDCWVHFHCQAGRGRTTTFMSFYDMLKNPDVPLKDILYRQTELGGTSLYYKGDRPNEQAWRVELFTETSWMVPLLYDYVQDNKENGYSVSWTDWKKKTFKL